MPGARGIAITTGIAVVALAVGLAAGYALRQPAPAQQPSGSESPAVPSSQSESVATTAPAPAVEPTVAPVSPPKVKPGTIVVRGSSGPTIFGPYTFKRGGYIFKFEQVVPDGQEFNETSLVIALESKPGEVDSPFQVLSNTSAMKGMNQVVVSGRLWVDVSFSGNDYVLTFTPKGK